jgi:hypothetical protein
MKIPKLGLLLIAITIVAGAAQAQFPTGNLTWSTSVNGNYTTLTNYTWTDAYGAHHFPGTATEYRTPSEPLHGGYIWVQGFHAVSDDGQGYSLDVNPYQNASGAFFLRNNVGLFGRANPKFLVLSVIYTPPGSQSTVNYGSGTTLGTSTSASSSFVNGGSVGVNANLSVGGAFTFGSTSGWQLTTDNTTSLAINNTTSNNVVVPGPAAPFEGIDHSLDIIVLWINPSVLFQGMQNGTTTYNYVVDERDTGYTVPEVLNIPVKWLRDPSTMPANVLARLDRPWAPGEGLTTADYQTILAADPFVDSGTGSTTVDTSSGRFTAITSLSYTPTVPGGQPITQTGSFTHQQISGTSATVTQSYTQSYSASGGFGFGDFLRATLNSSFSMTFSDKTTQALTNTSQQSATYSVKQPSSSYTGPVTLKVYQDNIYGSFVFGF